MPRSSLCLRHSYDLVVSRRDRLDHFRDGVVAAGETSLRCRTVPSSRLVSTNLLDLWFERVAKPRLRGEAYLVRYIDDFVLCFQYRADALRVQKALSPRRTPF